MKPYFSDPQKLAALQAEAASWFPTPFMPNAAIKHAGVSCQKLPGALYVATGFLPAGFNPPDGPMNWSNAHTDSLISKFMEEPSQAAKFAEITNPLEWQAGDMIGFLFLGCVQHCGVCLTPAGQFIHCLRDTQGVQYGNLRDATFMKRISKIWRPTA